MNLFVCDNCNNVDAVELAYKGQRLDHLPEGKPHWCCTQCQTGRWHDVFERAEYRPDFDMVINRATGIGLG